MGKKMSHFGKTIGGGGVTDCKFKFVTGLSAF